MSTYSLVIDSERCWGCRTCEVACKQEYEHRVKFIRITDVGPRMAEDGLEYFHVPTVCRHCDDPPCVEACPEQAITKRDDGIVVLDEETCSGCQSCIDACPYGAIDFDEETQHALKCNLCHHRVDEGLIPACADNVCLGHCIYFGDPVTIDDQIARTRQKRRTR